MISNKFLALQYSNGMSTLYFADLPALVMKGAPIVPGLEYDAYLHFEPGSGIADYIFQGTPYKMKEEQKQACIEYVNNIDIPGYAYDPSRYNIYVGMMNKIDAAAKGYKISYNRIDNEVSKFNEEKLTWEQIHAMLCPAGNVSFNILPLSQDIDDNTDTSKTNNSCSGKLKDAVMVFTKEEWLVFSASRKNETDVYDFKCNQWIDIRQFPNVLSSVKNRLENICDIAEKVVAQSTLGHMNVHAYNYYKNNPYYLEELPAELSDSAVKKELVQLISTDKILTDPLRGFYTKVLLITAKISAAKTLDDLDTCISNIANLEKEYIRH